MDELIGAARDWLWGSRRKHAGEVERYYCSFDESTVLTSMWGGHYLIYKKLVEHAEKVPTLDLCCGCGAGTRFLAESLSVRVVGVDYSRYAVDYARRHNSDPRVEYRILNVDKAPQLALLERIVRVNTIRQVFCVEGIEHIRDAEKVVATLIEGGVERIFISTPFAREGEPSEAFHISPFTPSVHRQFSVRFGAKTLCYLKPALVSEIRGLVQEGKDVGHMMHRYFTTSQHEASNYLIEIDLRSQGAAQSNGA